MSPNHRASGSNTPGTGMWWAGLVFFGLASLALNIAHAMATPSLDGWVAVLVGLVPVVACAFMSHGIGDTRPGVGIWVARVGILAVFVMGMWMSVDAQRAMVEPVLKDSAILLPLVLDLSTFISLYMIMSASIAADRAAIRADIEADIRPQIEADIRRTWEADMPRVRADIEADIRRTLEADMSAREADMRADIEADIRPRIEADIRREVEVEVEGRVRRELASKVKAAAGPKAKAGPKSVAAKADVSPGRKLGEDDLTTEDRMRLLLAQDPEMTTSDLADSLSVTPRTVRRLREKMLGEAPIEADMSASAEAL